MAAKKCQAIKKLKKQVKKLKARIDDISREITGLQNSTGSTVAEQMAAGLQEELTGEASPESRFSQEEAEMADELTEDAEEIADIREKKKQRKKGKK